MAELGGDPIATILFNWELGAGSGHQMQMRPLAEELVLRGHTVVMALRHLAGGAGKVFGHVGVRFLQAPFKGRGGLCFARTESFVHLLANVGWDDKHDLFPLACAWRHLIESVRPDAMVIDHGPTALLASRCMPDVKRIVLGAGFFIPPDRFPLPPFQVPGRAAPDSSRLIEDERRVLALANRLLEHWRLPPLERVGQLFGEADETFLLTFPEFDHYPQRAAQGATYWGPVNGPGGGKTPDWPAGDGTPVYAYLKPFPALPDLLAALNERRRPTLVFVDGVDASVRRRFTSSTLRFETEALDLGRVGRECGLAVVNANHGTMSQLLLAGRPVLQLPITLEQSVLAGVVERTGAALTASVRQGDGAIAKLDAMLAGYDPYAAAARAFAAKYAGFDPAAQLERMARRVEELLGGGERRAVERPARPAGVFRR